MCAYQASSEFTQVESINKVRKRLQPSSDPDLGYFNLPHFLKRDSQHYTEKCYINACQQMLYEHNLLIITFAQIWATKTFFKPHILDNQIVYACILLILCVEYKLKLPYHSKPSSGTEFHGSLCFLDFANNLPQYNLKINNLASCKCLLTAIVNSFN